SSAAAPAPHQRRFAMSSHALPTVDDPAVYIIHDNPDWITPFTDALDRLGVRHVEWGDPVGIVMDEDRKSTRLNSSHVSISYAVYTLSLSSSPTRRSSDLRAQPHRHPASEGSQ